jgi:hypothetical protein
LRIRLDIKRPYGRGRGCEIPETWSL